MRVLIVEDELGLARALHRGLTAEGFVVELAHDGETGLHLARENSYDAIVLDIMLPKLSGYRVCRALRAEENWVPILMLSAKDGEYDLADGLDLGADDYLTKPFSFVVLVARLRSVIRRGSVHAEPIISAGDLVLNAAARTVQRADDVIDLTPREFGVLEFLMSRRGEVVSKREILEHVWDAFYDGDPNVVEVYVGYLRKKVDAPYGRRAIQTVRGVGYRLDGEGG